VTPLANINDPASIERIYPFERFRQDANRNSLPNTLVLHGLTVVSPPGPDGSFHLQHAERQSGERDRSQDAVFLPATGGSGDLESEKANYAAFILRVIAAAPAVQAVQPADERLTGFHGG
jgi:hypothetical protein